MSSSSPSAGILKSLATAAELAAYVAGQADAAVRAADIALDRAREMRDRAHNASTDVRRLLDRAMEDAAKP